MRLSWLFKTEAQRIESEKIRGQENAKKFLATRPSAQEINDHWSSAKSCSAFGSSAERAYDKAYITVLRPFWEAIHG